LPIDRARGYDPPVIRIDKGPAPDIIGGKCNELISAMKRVHDVLVDAYNEQKSKGGRIKRTDAINERLIEAYLGRKPKTKKEGNSTSKKLASLHYGELVVHELPSAAMIFTPEAVEATRNDFEAEFTALHHDYCHLLRDTFEVWFKQSGLGEEQANLVWEQSGRFYQARRVRGVLGVAPGRLEIERFVAQTYAQERQSWPLLAELTLLFGQVLTHQHARAAEHSSEAELMQRLTGYAGTWTATVDQLFDYHRDRVVTLASSGRSYLALDDEAIAALARDDQKWRHVGNIVLAARVFARTLDDVPVPPEIQRTRPLIGWASDHFDSTYYSGNGIKQALLESHHGKCAYCEAPVGHIAHGDVEHFRPKAGYEEDHSFNSGGYFWQAYAWENLFYSCQICNQVHKGNQFPVFLDGQYKPARYGLDLDVSKEDPVLIDMGREDPRQYIRFNPIDGSAYPYDLVAAFFQKYPPHDTLGASSVEDLLYRSPNHIPLYRSEHRYALDKNTNQLVFEEGPPPHSLYEPLAPKNFWDFSAEVPVECNRGVLNILALGLNREKLVRERVRHLRQLRGMFWASHQGSEQLAARRALAEAVQPHSPYSSLAIDAIETWQRELERLRQVALNTTNNVQVELRTLEWIACYNEILARPLRPPPDYELPSKSAPLVYFVATKKIGSARTSREIVYLNADEDFEDARSGWYLQISEEDMELVAKVRKTRKRKGKKSVVTEKLSLEELFEKAHKKGGHNYFREATIVVPGPFDANLDC
jgi:uncharacterized protein (TIGR02646 family)